MSGYVLAEYLDCEKERAQLRAELAAAQAEAARYKALWDSVPWEVLGYVISVARAWSEDRQITAEAVDWFNATAPSAEEPQP